MKTLFFTVLAIFGYLLAPAQLTAETPAGKIVIGEAKQGARMVARLYYLINGTDTAGYLMFRNREFDAITDIQQIEFLPQPDLADSLFTIITRVQSTGQDAALTLGNTFVKVTKPKGFGGAVRIGTGEGFFYLTAKQLKELFGKVR